MGTDDGEATQLFNCTCMTADWHMRNELVLQLAGKLVTHQNEEGCLQPGWSSLEADPAIVHTRLFLTR